MHLESCALKIITHAMNGERNIGFLGPAFIGIGLFSELPEAEREVFREWLIANAREYRGDQFALRDRASWALDQALLRLPKIPTGDAMSNETKPISWRGRDLSTADAIMFYRGRAYSRPIGRGVVLRDLEIEPQLDEVLDTGNYEIEIRVTRRLPAD